MQEVIFFIAVKNEMWVASCKVALDQSKSTPWIRPDPRISIVPKMEFITFTAITEVCNQRTVKCRMRNIDVEWQLG